MVCNNLGLFLYFIKIWNLNLLLIFVSVVGDGFSISVFFVKCCNKILWICCDVIIIFFIFLCEIVKLIK